MNQGTLLSQRNVEGNLIQKIHGGVLDVNSLKTLQEKRDILCALSFLIHNTKPVGHQVLHAFSFHMHAHSHLYRLRFLFFFFFFEEILVSKRIFKKKKKCMQDLVGLVISMLLLGDFSLVLLTMLQLYSVSLADVFLFLFILPLGILLPFPAGINALFSHGPRRSAGLARVYALWNVTSLVNVVSCIFHFLAHH